ncbi:alpha-amylase family protein [Spirochaeta isovalerica]|uniref:Amylosucrase n=1 Tax=Spirochaeta isovalerica TaxID=150 RepID=A0A841R7X8_9SPIO|nr:alpha-amylase family protein [Spirochaeta isovalerica]MBB6478582.1 amylosucrase [Spirochaeta isovalerica]
MWTDEKILEKIKRDVLAAYKDSKIYPEFEKGLNARFPSLWKNYFELYGHRFDCLYQLEDLIRMVAEEYAKRANLSHNERTAWFEKKNPVAIMLYVDLFNKNLSGLEKKLDYFKDLGVTAVHLMPLFRSPEGDNDGGYAVSDYKQVQPDLGTMEQLSDIAGKMRKRGIHLIVDFILNHTSDEHLWSRKARTGYPDYRDYYYIFDTREEADEYDRTLREIFPSVRKGSFTYLPEIEKWVWTTFNSFQWDLNYSNPAVFRDMSHQMLFLANRGVDVLRLDALAFTWKEKGTGCENLPKAHTLIRLFKNVAAIAAPGLSFLSEAIVHPDDVVKYISPEECELSYNPLQMATTWEALATRNTSLLQKTFSPRFHIPETCRWVNYIRCHDDIGWTFCDNDAASLGIDGYGHRKFLNAFYTGRFEGSFASGVPFQENLETGDARISGTLASMAGLEKALMSGDSDEVKMALDRIRLLSGFLLSLPGIPLIYSGDELAVLNDYSYLDNEEHRSDSRWIHRMPFPWDALEQDKKSPAMQILEYTKKMIRLRKDLSPFRGTMELIDTGSTNLIGFRLTDGSSHLIIIANFTERPTPVRLNTLRLYGGSYYFEDLLSNESLDSDIDVKPYGLLWLQEVFK